MFSAIKLLFISKLKENHICIEVNNGWILASRDHNKHMCTW